MQMHDIVVMGASAGGVEALLQLVPQLPKDTPATFFLVQHVSASHRSVLPELLSRAGHLPALHPKDGDPVVEGRLYIAPPDHHLILAPGVIRVVRGPKENGHRPAADVLFRTAARSYGPRVVGVVLTGAMDCGTAGLLAVKRRGGIAVVQDPKTASCPDMPRAALEHVPVDHCVPLAELPELLRRLVRLPVPEGQATRLARTDSQFEAEVAMASIDPHQMHRDDKYGTPSVLTCPECAGTLYQIEDEGLERFRCRVGHAYTPASLLVGQHEALEGALWAALRALEEHASLARRLSQQAQARSHFHTSVQFAERASAAEQQALLLRTTLLQGVGGGEPERDRAIEAQGGRVQGAVPGGAPGVGPAPARRRPAAAKAKGRTARAGNGGTKGRS